MSYEAGVEHGAGNCHGTHQRHVPRTSTTHEHTTTALRLRICSMPHVIGKCSAQHGDRDNRNTTAPNEPNNLPHILRSCQPTLVPRHLPKQSVSNVAPVCLCLLREWTQQGQLPTGAATLQHTHVSFADVEPPT